MFEPMTKPGLTAPATNMSWRAAAAKPAPITKSGKINLEVSIAESENGNCGTSEVAACLTHPMKNLLMILVLSSCALTVAAADAEKSPEQKLAALGLTLPASPKSVANYVSAVRSG